MKSASRILVLAPLFGALLLAACGGSAQRLDRYLQRGNDYYAEKNWDKARIEYRNALQIDPKSATARMRLGQVAEKQGKVDEALGNYRAALDADQDNQAARAAVARIYLLGGVPDKARELIEPGLQKEPSNPQLLTVRSALRRMQGDADGALADAEAAHAASPDDELAIAVLASLYRGAGRDADALKVVAEGVAALPTNIDLRIVLADLKMHTGDADGARSLLEEVIALEPKSLVHRQRLARFFLLNKDPASAEIAMRDAVKAVPDDVALKLSLVDLIGSQGGPARAEAQIVEFVTAEPKNAELKLALGQFYQGSGNIDKAKGVYQQLVDAEGLRTGGLTARNRLAAIALEARDTATAEKLIAEVLKENARDSEALVMRANMALARGEAIAAITDLRAVLRDKPDAVLVMRALARAHVQNAEPVLAEQILRDATRINPRDVAARMDLVALLAQTGRVAEARPLLEQMLIDAPTDVGVHEAYFRVQVAQSEFAAAQKTADEVKRLRPGKAAGYLLSGRLQELKKATDLAIREYEGALKVQPDSVDALSALVRIDMQQKQYQRALARIDAVIAKWPENPLAREFQGEVLLADGRVEAAIAAFDAAIARNPDWWMPYRGKALARLAQKKEAEAIETLKAGVSRTRSFELVSQLARMLESGGRHDEAIKVYEEAVASNPRSLVAANNLAMLLVTYRSDKASLDRASTLADSLTEAGNPAFLDTRGWVKFKRADYGAAAALLQQAVEKAPTAPALRYHLGMALLKSGDATGARQHLETAVKSSANFEGVEEARAALKSLAASG